MSGNKWTHEPMMFGAGTHYLKDGSGRVLGMSEERDAAEICEAHNADIASRNQWIAERKKRDAEAADILDLAMRNH